MRKFLVLSVLLGGCANSTSSEQVSVPYNTKVTKIGEADSAKLYLVEFSWMGEPRAFILAETSNLAPATLEKVR
jgi:hypothetical protein